MPLQIQDLEHAYMVSASIRAGGEVLCAWGDSDQHSGTPFSYYPVHSISQITLNPPPGSPAKAPAQLGSLPCFSDLISARGHRS